LGKKRKREGNKETLKSFCVVGKKRPVGKKNNQQLKIDMEMEPLGFRIHSHYL